MAKKDTLVHWLRDAHAMEAATVDNLGKQVEWLKDYPEFQARIRRHLDESKQQLVRLEQCLDIVGADKSTLKEMFTKFLGRSQGYLSSTAEDAVLKQAISMMAFENFEIASYCCLIAAAERFEEPEIRRLCSTSLAEEQEMASWLNEHMPDLAHLYLEREALGRPEARGAAE